MKYIYPNKVSSESIYKHCHTPLRFCDLLINKGMEAATYMERIDPEDLINAEIASKVKLLWKEDAIQQIYAQRAIYHLDDSSKYFFESIDRIKEENYCPSDKDILLVRYRTTGVIESRFAIRGSNFHIFDVGGMCSLRSL